MTELTSESTELLGSDPDLVVTESRKRGEHMRPILWRLHFLGGFLAGPIVLSFCITGILFAWNPQIDGIRFGDVVNAPDTAATEAISLASQVEAAQTAYPDWGTYAVTPSHDGMNTAVLMDPPGGGFGFGGPDDGVDVYVDPVSGEVTGTIAGSETANAIFRGWHSSWSLGSNAEPLTELAGAWFLASLLSGLYLWWPTVRSRRLASLVPRAGLGGRRQTKEWHSAMGALLFVPLLVLVATGLTWTEFSGDRVDLVRENLLNVERGGVQAGLDQEVAGVSALANIDLAYAAAQSEGLVEPIEIRVPVDDSTAWQVNSRDERFPVERDQIVVDETGSVISSYDYDDEHWFQQLRTMGILFHQAELFGVFTQLFLTTLAVGVFAMVVLGYVMWWQRRPEGGFGSPPSIRSWIRRAPVSVLLFTAFLAWLLPTLGASLLIWLIVERGWHWFQAVRGTRTVERLSIDVPLAAALAVGGAAMFFVGSLEETFFSLGVGNAEDGLSTIPRLIDFLWSWPLGVLFVVIGVTGLIAPLVPRRERPGVDIDLDAERSVDDKLRVDESTKSAEV